MKIDSKLFDRIRVKPDQEQVLRETLPPCEWEGCENAGTHPAPKGRGAEGQYHRFCIDHVRLYNKSYNYFAGMGDEAVAAYQKDSMTGHRPTWAMGANAGGWARAPFSTSADAGRDWVAEASVVLRRARARRTPPPEPPRRRLKTLELKSLDVLGLSETASGPEIKSRYKELVKRHHPDANGGDRSNEDLLQEIIRAYNHLRSVGLA